MQPSVLYSNGGNVTVMIKNDINGLNRLFTVIDDLYKVKETMLQYDSTLKTVQDDAQIALSEEGAQTMAKHRIRICIGYNNDGTPIIKQISGNSEIELSDRIAINLLRSARKDYFLSECGLVNNLSSVTKTMPTFKEYTERSFMLYKKGKLKPKTLRGYNVYLKCHLYPMWGDTPVDQITADAVQAFLNEKADHSKKSLQQMLNLLKQILSYAVDDKLIESNPAASKRIYIPSTKMTERKGLAIEELRDVINHLDALRGFDRRFMALTALTGLRRGEVLGLRWEDIDLSNNVIHVVRNVTHTSNRPIIGTPKTDKGTRDVPIINGLLNYLSPMQISGYIVAHDSTPDEPLTMSAYKHMWDRIKKTINVYGITPHGFRHTLATQLFESGADIKTVQSVVGHADVSTTMNTYVHASDSRKQEYMEKLGNRLTA